MADIEHTLEPSQEIPQKTCTLCHQAFPATTEYFHKNTQAKSGLYPACRDCKNTQGRNHYQVTSIRRKNKRMQKRQQTTTCSSDLLVKVCSQCQKAWPRQHPYFYHDSSTKDGLTSHCKECLKQYAAAHKDEALARSLAWQKANPERRKATMQRHKDKVGSDHINALARARRNKNPEAHAEACRRYYEKFPDKRRIKLHVYVTRKAGLPCTYTEGQWQVALSYWKNCCAVCEQQADGLFHTIAMDHWIPLASPLCPGTIATNIVPLCHGLHSCNNQKSNKGPEVWLVEKLGARKAKKKLKDITAFFLYMEAVEG